MSEANEATLLDYPVRSALMTGNRALAEGGPLAWRYPAAVSPFAAVREETAACFAALAGMVPPDGGVALVAPEPLTAPAGFVIDMQAPIAQMILRAPLTAAPPAPPSPELGAADLAEMLDLTERTRPGPFGPRTPEFGRYIGIRENGLLAAMTGERMRIAQFIEISAVCVDPAHRGRGYATLLIQRLAERQQADGLTPFLHVFSSNAGAIALYEKLGFVTRRTLHVTVLTLATG